MELEQSLLESSSTNNNELNLDHVHTSSQWNGGGSNLKTSSQNIPWGRLIRAPLKKKGHIAIDYCTGGGLSDEGDDGKASSSDTRINGMEKGRILRHTLSKGKSNNLAPGLYAAARKARWGGLWPDLATNEYRRNEDSDDGPQQNDLRTTAEDERFLKGLKDLISEGKE